MTESNLKPVRSKEEARERGRKGGIASAASRKAKKSMRETAKTLLNMTVVEPKARENLAALGINKSDMNYTTAVVVRLMRRALADGDTSAIRLLGELTGELNNQLGIFGAGETGDLNEYEYPVINIPSNGRDKVSGNYLSPQAGPQTLFMMSDADIVIYGGAAGGGKTYALLMEALRHKDVKGFGAVIFRDNYTQITSEGGLWDTTYKIYSMVPGAQPKKTPKFNWRFASGAKVSFAHLGCDDDLQSWQGSQICYIGFDELTHFTKKRFFYMLSRNRSTCGVKPYMRATCNPDVDSWVAEFIAWWINQDTGYPIKERSGLIRYMVVLNDIIYWGDSKQEVFDNTKDIGGKLENIKSVTFIASNLYDNKILMEIDPGYEANLNALTEVEKERLLKGNWKIKPSAGSFFKRTQIGNTLTILPDDIVRICRGWDLAATDEDENENAAFTAGVLLAVRASGRFLVIDVLNQQLKAGDVRKLIKTTAFADRAKYGASVCVRLPQDPGQAGKDQAQSYIKYLAGFTVKTICESGSKETRAEPVAAVWQHGFFDVMEGAWNEMYFNQLESFPASKFKDMVDATSSAFNELTLGSNFDINNML